MQKLLTAVIFSTSIIFISCKKDNNTTPPPAEQIVDPVGTWHVGVVTQGNTNLSTESTYDTLQFPCLKNNLITVNADKTATSYYTGTDTCFVYKNSNSNYEAVGEPGEAVANFTWSQTGNVFTLTNVSDNFKDTAQLSVTNGHYLMLFHVAIGNTGNYESTLNVK